MIHARLNLLRRQFGGESLLSSQKARLTQL